MVKGRTYWTTLALILLGLAAFFSEFASARENPVGAEQQCINLRGQWISGSDSDYCEVLGQSEDSCDQLGGSSYKDICRIAPSGFVKSIGSKSECVNMGGKWRTQRYSRYNSLTECQQVPMPEKECKSSGGDFDDNSCTFGASRDYEGSVCEKVGGVWDESNQRCFSDRDRKRCLRGGGKWHPVGRARSYACVHYSEDGGKACSGPSECKLRRCVVLSRPDDVNVPVVGECAKTDSNFGCSWTVVGGYVTEGGCVD